jgi:lysozyme family protein
MNFPFAALAPEYAHLLATAKITRTRPVMEGVDRIMRVLPSYLNTAAETDVPATWIGPTDCREDDCDPRCGIGQGDPWSRVSVNVPRGEGPFSSKAAADRFYLHYDRIDVLQGVMAWDLVYAAWCWERWNGFGPRAHGRLSGYPWSCTDVYDPPRYGGRGNGGKYVRDGVWDPDAVDEQPGAVALYLELIQRRPDLALPAGAALPPIAHDPVAVPLPPPEGVHDAESLQLALNRLGIEPPLRIDGSFGRMTRRAVESFQHAHGLAVDGIAGPATWAAIAALEAPAPISAAEAPAIGLGKMHSLA